MSFSTPLYGSVLLVHVLVVPLLHYLKSSKHLSTSKNIWQLLEQLMPSLIVPCMIVFILGVSFLQPPPFI